MPILVGLKGQAQFALDHAPQIIDYFSEIFQIDYPLPKCDLLAVHEFVSVPLYIAVGYLFDLSVSIHRSSQADLQAILSLAILCTSSLLTSAF
jgi:hypothetical protein